MRHIILAIAYVSVLSGCVSTVEKSAYTSGWTQKHSLKTQEQCGLVWIDKDHYMPGNLQVLVTYGLLTSEQAARVPTKELRVGDPECMVHATFGITQSRVVSSRDAKQHLISVRFTYRCENSPVGCPGVEVDVADNHVASITPLPPPKAELMRQP